MIRFWDNRFLPPTEPLKILEDEIQRLREQNSGLVDRLLSPVNQPTVEHLEGTDSKPEPYTQNVKTARQVPWEIKRRELELMHRKAQPAETKKGTDLETFEKNLQELEG
jgi:hypothetical protein